MIQLFRPVYRVEETLASIREVLEAGWTGIGGKCVEFEEAFKKYTDLPHAQFLNSATSGLQLAIRLGVQKASEDEWVNIATSPLTFVATNHSIVNENLLPFFIDVDESLNMKPSNLEAALQTKKISAVIFTGIGGNPKNLREVSEICSIHKIPLILDASHMVGTLIYDRHVGREADFTVFSTQAVKNLSTGDGGFLCCRYEEDDKLAKKLSWLGISKTTWNRREGDWDYQVDYLGNKWHGNAVAAAIGLVGLKYISADNLRRREIAQRYIAELDLKYKLIPHYQTSARHLCQVRVPPDSRSKIIWVAKSKGVQLGVHYRCNTEYMVYRNHWGKCPFAEKISQEVISLPIGTHLSDLDVTKVIEVLNSNECISLVKEYPAF